MSSLEAMIAAHPDRHGSVDAALLACIEACFSCAQFCISCADASLAEEMVAELRRCIRLDLDCADLCLATGKLAIRRTGANGETLAAALEACATLCRLCAEECDRHAARHEHCRLCAEECRRCEAACREAIGSIR